MAEQEQNGQPEVDGAKAVKREQISLLYYKEYLQEQLRKHQGKVAEIEGLLSTLDEASRNPKLIVNCYETETGVVMVKREKPPLGFAPPQNGE